MSFEILHDHFCNTIRIWWIRACISHRTSSAVQVLPHNHWHLPNAYKYMTKSKLNWTQNTIWAIERSAEVLSTIQVQFTHLDSSLLDMVESCNHGKSCNLFILNRNSIIVGHELMKMKCGNRYSHFFGTYRVCMAMKVVYSRRQASMSHTWNLSRITSWTFCFHQLTRMELAFLVHH